MNFIEQESKVITKLLRDTINRKILWQRHPNLVLQDASIATNNLISPQKMEYIRQILKIVFFKYMLVIAMKRI